MQFDKSIAQHADPFDLEFHDVARFQEPFEFESAAAVQKGARPFASIAAARIAVAHIAVEGDQFHDAFRCWGSAYPFTRPRLWDV